MKNKKYYLGLDLGTNSVGWAVVDENNDVVRINNFRLWGVRLFSEANPSSECRNHRNSRRRLSRRRDRIMLLQNEFNKEISLIDPKFFQRINDSFYHKEDKTFGNHYTFFDDTKTDYDYFKEYPTIYHLRKRLLEDDSKIDIRMLYLACHHIIKYRGNFLSSIDENASNDESVITSIFETFNELVSQSVEYDEDNEDYYQHINIEQDGFYNLLKEIMVSDTKKSDKEKQLLTLFGVGKKNIFSELIVNIMLDSPVNISTLLLFKKEKKDKIEIKPNDESFEDTIEQAKINFPILSSFFDLLPSIKEVSSHFYIKQLLNGKKYVSDALVELYETHQNELTELKSLIKTYLPNKYYECFKKVEPSKYNYPSYIGMNKTGSYKRFKHCERKKFYDYISGLLSEISSEEAKPRIEIINSKIEKEKYLLRQNSGKNSAIPMQLHLKELSVILKNQSKHYSFLTDETDGLSCIDRIISIFKYRIPYYVGPTSNHSKRFGWITRTNEPLKPWNFDKVVNLDECAKSFINRMQNKCTYLHGPTDYCLPKNSLLYSEFMCLDYLNSLKVDGNLLDKEVKLDLYNNLFITKKKVSVNDIKQYFTSHYGEHDLSLISEPQFQMSSYVIFRNIFKDKFDENKSMIEEIIKDITIFEDKNILEKRLKEIYLLDEELVKTIKGITFKDYGKLCKNLLTSIEGYDSVTGESCGTIIQLLRKTDQTLQQILFDSRYNFQEAINNYNKSFFKNDSLSFKEFIEEEIYTSPINKRALIQSYKIIEEVESILGHPIDQYYIECTRENREKKATVSRFDTLKELYDDCKTISKDLNSYYIDINRLSGELEYNSDKLRSEKLYLYFTQLGKSVYTLKEIDINKLDTDYDIDHIYPQSLIKDDSFSNTVLVEKRINQDIKRDKFLCEVRTDFGVNQERLFHFYKLLLDKRLITKEKYRRLTERSEPNLDGFIERQLVATNQSVVALKQLLVLYKHVKETDVVFSRASIVSEYRNNYDLYKSRNANNFHHAHDAYLNVVVGKAIKTYFNVMRLAADYHYTIVPEKILTKNIYDLNGFKVYDRDDTLKKVNEYIYLRHDIHTTVQTRREDTILKKVTIVPAKEAINSVPLKSSTPRSDTSKYGGYTSNSYTNYSIVRTLSKDNIVEYQLIGIPGMYRNNEYQYIKMLLEKEMYVVLEIVKSNLPINLIFEEASKKFCLSGVSKKQIFFINLKEKYFDVKMMYYLHNLEKYNNQLMKKEPITITDNEVVLYLLRKNKEAKKVSFTKEDTKYMYNYFLSVFSKPIYAYSSLKNCYKAFANSELFDKLTIEDELYILTQVTKLLNPNNKDTVDLKLLNGAENTGSLYIKRILPKGLRLVAESITGYYKKVIFEVPDELS